MREAIRQVMPLVLFFAALWAMDAALNGQGAGLLILIGIAGFAGYSIRGYVTH